MQSETVFILPGLFVNLKQFSTFFLAFKQSFILKYVSIWSLLHFSKSKLIHFNFLLLSSTRHDINFFDFTSLHSSSELKVCNPLNLHNDYYKNYLNILLVYA